MERLGRVVIAGTDVRVDHFSLGPIAFLDRIEIGIRGQFKQFQRAQFIAATGTIA